MSEKNTIEELEKGRVKIKYNTILETELLRIDFIKEVFELRTNKQTNIREPNTTMPHFTSFSLIAAC